MMTARGLQQAVARLDVHRASWVEVLPGDRVREIVEALPEQYGLRSLDSFQPAAALVWCKEQPRGRLFVCCDVAAGGGGDECRVRCSPITGSDTQGQVKFVASLLGIAA
jgi:hypothetical protein